MLRNSVSHYNRDCLLLSMQVPFRNSKLTYLLQVGFAEMIAAATPASISSKPPALSLRLSWPLPGCHCRTPLAAPARP